MSDLSYNILGVVTGTLGLLGLIPVAWIYTQLPSRKLHALERLVEETDALFRKGLEDGLHTGEVDLFEYHSGMLDANISLDDLRNSLGSLKSWRADLKAWWRGLSRAIAHIHRDVNELRLQLIDISARSRRRLAAAGYANALAKYSGALSEERRSSILSLAARGRLSTSSVCGYAQVGGVQSDCVASYAPPRRTDSPLPMPVHDASFPPPPSTNPHTRDPGPLHEDAGHVATSDAALQPLPSATLNAAQRRGGDWDPTRGDPATPYVSDADLKHLLALALTSSCCRREKGNRHHAIRRDVLLRCGKHLFGLDDSFDGLDIPSHARHSKRARLKMAKGRVRESQGLSSRGMGEAVRSADADDESLVLGLAQDDERDAAEWQDE